MHTHLYVERRRERHRWTEREEQHAVRAVACHLITLAGFM